MATPLEIDIALHYWTRGTDYGADGPDFNIDAPAVREQRSRMCEAQLLEANEPGTKPRYKAGPALSAYVNALCAVPWPVQVWTIPRRTPHLPDKMLCSTGMSENGVG